MRKIDTLFVRDENDRRHVLPFVTPGCEWVTEGEGYATRKWDGTCVLIHRDGIAVHGYARRVVKPDGNPPPNFRLSEYDETTRKSVGWEPIDQSGFAKFFAEAVTGEETPGTYELCGPKMNGNPEGMMMHSLIPHGRYVFCGPDMPLPEADGGEWHVDPDEPPRDYDGLRVWLLEHSHEGIVWWHPDGRRVKLKRRDFSA